MPDNPLLEQLKQAIRQSDKLPLAQNGLARLACVVGGGTLTEKNQVLIDGELYSLKDGATLLTGLFYDCFAYTHWPYFLTRLAKRNAQAAALVAVNYYTVTSEREYI